MSRPYIDTSALAKRYVAEAGSDELDAFLQQQKIAEISRLTIAEFRCLLARRKRNHEITPAMEKEILASFDADIRAGHFLVQPLADSHASLAFDLIGKLARYALRTLDALHLAIALESGTDTIATADGHFADAAKALGFRVKQFG